MASDEPDKVRWVSGLEYVRQSVKEGPTSPASGAGDIDTILHATDEE